ncbi:MAG: ABC transporter substrate-binding protein [Halodesulfurarchaeum sp.]
MKRRDFLRWAGATASLSLAGCSTGGQSIATTLDLAYDAAPPHFQAVVMDRKEWFESMESTVESEKAGCKSIVQLLVSEKADIGMIGIVPALVVADSSVPVSIVSASSKDAFVVMITEESTAYFAEETGGFTAFAADRGREFRLGTYSKGSVSDITARYWIQEVRGESVGDVELVPLGGPGAARQALLAGEVDGAVIPEPTPTLIEERTEAPYERFTAVGEFIPGEPAGVTVVRDAFAEEHPDAVETFVANHAEATQFIRDSPGEAARYMSEVYGGEDALDRSTARNALENPATTYITDPGTIVDGTSVLTEYAATLGKTEERIRTDALFDMSYYEQAVTAE